MIKYHINKKKAIRFTVNGSAHELMKETACLVSLVYNSIKKEYPERAENFKHDLLTVLLGTDSPVWKENDLK